MKLIYRILFNLSYTLAIILAVWGFLFYITIIDEVNDEVDDVLEDYSENIILRALAGHELPSRPDGTNNSYYLSPVSPKYAQETSHIRYSDEMIYNTEKEETEPARILRTIFKNDKEQYFELTVSTPTIEKEDLQDAILNWIILLYFTLLIIVLIINIWIYQRSMNPLYVLLKWLDQYTIGKIDSLPELKTDIVEFKKLNEALLRSTQRNQIIFEQQKQFIGNASHELQTPLAICQNRLEMLTENESLSEEQLQELTKVQQTLSYIIRLNKSLLFLAKIENGQFQNPKTININALIHQQLEDYKEIYHYKEISVYIHESGELKINMNETLGIALISNLLKNAYNHNYPKGHIRIHLTPNYVNICNTGNPEALDVENIFQRFYQGKSKGEGSAGLGLSIALAICHLYHLNLQYDYAIDHCFKLSLEK